MKSQHAHMKQIILPKTVLEFTSLAIDDGFMKKNGLAPLSQKENQDHVIQKVPKKFGIFPACSYKTGKKNQPPTHKKYLWVGGVYTMENNDTNTVYHKFVRVEDQK